MKNCHRNILSTCLFTFGSICAVAQESTESLVPTTPSTAPDYFCTWNVQGYVDNYNTIRGNINEQYMFGNGHWEGWVNFFPEIRQDLLFVMDDSWDIPAGNNVDKDKDPNLGMLELNSERFPSFNGSALQRLKHLTDSVKSYGWKGLGGWVCAQKAAAAEMSDEDFWKDRMTTAEKAGFAYWKVDWGHQSIDDAFRRMLTEKGRQYAPHLIIEAAMKDDYITFADTYRTYDVENIIAQPVTIDRVAGLLMKRKQGQAMSIVNCEDEPEIAAGLGCAIGIMRHPFAGRWPDGQTDYAFPETGRNYKKRMAEVIRGVRWHRIAPPFGVADDCIIDDVRLNDYWTYHDHESWRRHKEGEQIKGSAPARISRRMPLPIVGDTTELRPYVLASQYPNGAVCVVTLGRTIGREFIERRVPVSIEVNDVSKPIGVFGYYESLTINFKVKLPRKRHLRILAQDLAGDTPTDITKMIRITKDSVIIPGTVIEKIGKAAQAADDVSAPGLVIKLESTR